MGRSGTMWADANLGGRGLVERLEEGLEKRLERLEEESEGGMKLEGGLKEGGVRTLDG